MILNDRNEAVFQLTFKDEAKEDQVVVMADFIGVKTPKGKGKRFTTLDIKKITDITPAPPVEEEPEPEPEEAENPDSNGDFEPGEGQEEVVEEARNEAQEETPAEVTPEPVQEETPAEEEKPAEQPAEEAVKEEPVKEESVKEESAKEETAPKPKKKSSRKKKDEPAPELNVPFEIVSKMPEDSMPYQADEDGQLSLF